ncbi:MULTISPECIES: T9SS type A sorting domain-containing protein [unclassified Pedobacter]|uniref:T9SS type A sorting domain-containing protein n=1 Tax=Pedobacter sp. ok626 TaxID=1761882 RepID=UPI0014042800
MVDLSVNSGKAEQADLSIYNLNGTALLKTKVMLEKGSDKFTLLVSTIKPGIHIAILTTNSNATRLKSIR